jgi:phosphoglycerol transferase MdoB-like AlkP superfamily enzyme
LAAPGLGSLLAAHHYRTALFHPGRFRFLDMDLALRPSGFAERFDASALGGGAESSFGVSEEAAVGGLLRWLDGLRPGERFAVAYLPIAGHHPYASPPGGPFPTDTQLGCYRNALHYADRSIRALWDGLRARGHGEDTLWCIAGDHGQAFGEHAGNFGHTFWLYDENLRVPLLFALPGHDLPPAAIPRTLSHLDVLPALLDLLGLPVPATAEGRSVFEPTPAAPVFFFTDWGDLLLGLRDGPWKYVLDVTTSGEQLFHLDTDAAEHTDLAAREPERCARYRARVLAWGSRPRSGS